MPRPLVPLQQVPKKTNPNKRLVRGAVNVQSTAWAALSSRGLDGRYRLGQTIRRIRVDLETALGGPEEITPQVRILIDRVVYKTIRCHLYEAAHFRGDTKGGSDKYYLAWANSLRNDLLALGLGRKEKQVIHDLKAYIESEANES